MHKAVGMYYNVNRGDIVEIAQQVADIFASQHVECYVSDKLLAACAGVRYLPEKEFLDTVTMMVVIGGDGTFLRAANIVREAGIPMVGINRGALGFLAEIEVEELAQNVKYLINEKYVIEERMTICADIYRDGRFLTRAVGLNDVCLNRDPVENTLELDVFMFNQLIDSYQADGIVIATPTGSTGYSMSAGGPLIYPGTECLIVNPICPHILGTNPVIVPDDSAIDVTLTHSTHDGYLMTDGRLVSNVRQGDTVRVYKGDETIRIIQVEEHQFFETVRHKLLDRNYRRLHRKEESDEE